MASHFDAEIGSYFMKRCFELAERGSGFVSPNPLVGCVIVRDGDVVSEGWHQEYGGPHAEANAILNSPEKSKGADLYCNLEPCSHYDKKTPPCVPLIVKSGIKRVFISNRDPNPKVNGSGIRELNDNGIEVIEGIESKRGSYLNRFYFKLMKIGEPYVTLKIARSIDNKIAKIKGERTIITGAESQAYVHGLRSVHDAVLVGANTVTIDNPRLNVRKVEGRNPKRVIIDGRLTSPVESRIFHTEGSSDTIVFTSKVSDRGKKALLKSKGVKIFELDSDKNSRLNISEILTILKNHKIISVLVEGGSEIFAQFTELNLFDELIILQAPLIFGGGVEATLAGSEIGLELLDSSSLGNDTRTVFINNKNKE